MADYLTNTERERKQMLKQIGVSKTEDLFVDIPQHLRIEKLDLPSGKSQQETMRIMSSLAETNKVFPVVMRGAGSYNHYIPSIVPNLASRSEFLTAYTPYQAEMSQGILQVIFEYQSLICGLTGMDVSNASVYNGSTAAADAILMCGDKKRNIVLMPENTRPDTLDVVKTYLSRRDMEIKLIPLDDGRVDLVKLKEMLNEQIACVYLEQPNYYGLIEESEEIANLTHECGAKFILSANPISLGLLKSPREVGADIAVGEAQPFGMPMAFGGPYLGFVACTEKEMRKMPGRIVGETVDSCGNRAYVLTLQAREQHIRREKAFSNICSNQAHCALTASIYLAAMGTEGLREVAETCTALAHFAAESFEAAGAKLKYKGEFFHEFVTETSATAEDILGRLAKKGILGGLKLSEHEILWCMTEMVEKSDIKKAAAVIKGANV